LSNRGRRIGSGLFGSASAYGLEGGSEPTDFPSPRSVEDEEKFEEVARCRDDFSGLRRLPPRAESGPIDSRLCDWRGRIRGSEMPERVLSSAAAANAKRPPVFCEPVKDVVEGLFKCWGRRLFNEATGASVEGVRREAVEDSGEFEETPRLLLFWQWPLLLLAAIVVLGV
jgi:hypothetical protein